MSKKYRKNTYVIWKSTPELILYAVLCAVLGIWFYIKTGSIEWGMIFLGLTIFFLLPVGYRLLRKYIKKQKYLNSSLELIDNFTGEEFEEFLKAHFEKQGYKVTLTPKSFDYGVDLVCKKSVGGSIDMFVVQAKRYNGKVGITAVQQVIGGMHYYGCYKGYVITNSYFTDSAWGLAKKSNIILWDRNILTEKFRI